jgi:DNA-binding NarL/FixJ family response regulator
MNQLKILLVDDHAVVREGVGRLLADRDDIVLTGVSCGAEALAHARKEPPDLVLLDLNMKGISGLELLRHLLLKSPKVRVIIFSMHFEPSYAARALRLGAKGYLSKSASADELLTAIKRVSEGGHYIERELASTLAISQLTGDDPLQQLTNREIEILRHLGSGKSLSAIADALGVSYKTVANSCSLIKNKLGLERTADLIRASIEMLGN